MAIVYDVIGSRLIKGRGRKIVLRFKEELLYLMVKVRCPYHVPLQRFRLSKLSQKHSEMGVPVLNWPEYERVHVLQLLIPTDH